MALKIKTGSVVSPYGVSAQSFDENSVLSQPILAHLKTRFPDDIEGEDEGAKIKVTKKYLAAHPELAEKGIKAGDMIDDPAGLVAAEEKLEGEDE